MPAEELSALEVECSKLPAEVEKVPDNNDDPRPIHKPLDTSVPDQRQLHAMVEDISGNDVTAEEIKENHQLEVSNDVFYGLDRDS